MYGCSVECRLSYASQKCLIDCELDVDCISGCTHLLQRVYYGYVFSISVPKPMPPLVASSSLPAQLFMGM